MPILVFILSLTLGGCSFLNLSKAPEDESDRELASVEEPAKEIRAKRKEIELRDTIRENPEEPTKLALRKRVLVLPFRNQSDFGGLELSQFAADEVKNSLKSLDSFVVVNEKDVRDLDKAVLPTGELDMAKIFELARAHGVVALVTGNIQNISVKEKGSQIGIFQTRYNTIQAHVQVELWEVLNQKPLSTKDFTAEVTEENTEIFGNRSLASKQSSQAEGAISEAIQQILPSFSSEAQRLGWTGRIAKIDLHRFYINAGELSGVTRNQILRVFGEAEPIIDKESGLMIGMAPGRFKGLLKVVDFFGEDGAIAIVHSGAGFQEKDRVEAFTPPTP